MGDLESCYNARKTLVREIEKAPGFRTLYPRNYLASLTNFAAICENLGKYDEAYSSIENIKSMLNSSFKNEKINSDLWSKIIIPISETELSYYIKTCKFEQLDKIINRIMADVNKYTQKSSESRKIVMFNSVAYAYFINKEYNEALIYLNKTLNYSFTSPEEKSYTIARIFNLIVHFEMENYNLLEHIIKSTRQYLVKKNRLYPLEKLIIDFINDAISINNDKKMKELMIKLKDGIETSYPGIQEQKPLEFFDIISWIESKLRNRDFKDILKEKASGISG
jgi:tetratricopeptide (TPR) repeat protein